MGNKDTLQSNFFRWVLGINLLILVISQFVIGYDHLAILFHCMSNGVVFVLNMLIALLLKVSYKDYQAKCFFLAGLIVGLVGFSVCIGGEFIVR